MILNLGSGTDPVSGALNVDINPDLPGVDVIANIEQGLELPDNSVSGVFAKHILEHIHNLPKVIGEIHRICKNGAEVEIHCPHYTNPSFYDDPSHVRPWSENTANFIAEQSKDGKLGFKGEFKVLANYMLGEPWSREKPTVVVCKLQVVKGE